jgi:hypothetical protein
MVVNEAHGPFVFMAYSLRLIVIADNCVRASFNYFSIEMFVIMFK